MSSPRVEAGSIRVSRARVIATLELFRRTVRENAFAVGSLASRSVVEGFVHDTRGINPLQCGQHQNGGGGTHQISEDSQHGGDTGKEVELDDSRALFGNAMLPRQG